MFAVSAVADSIKESRDAGGLLRFLASRWLTVAAFAASVVCVLAIAADSLPPTAGMALPAGLFAVNIGAAIAQHPWLRASLPLLVLHLALVMLLVLFVVGRLTYFEGAFSVTRGQTFDGTVEKVEAGPWHSARYRQLRFVNAGMEEHFVHPTTQHFDMRAAVRWQDEELRWHQAHIEFGYPLVLDGYRITLSGHRGFTTYFVWRPDGGPAQLGTVQLFGPYEGQMEDSNDWRMPNGQSAWVKLERLKDDPPKLGDVRVNLDAERLEHKLVWRIGDDRRELRLGESMQLPGGSLQYVRLGTWVGYEISHDPTVQWLVATVITAVLALVAFYWAKFSRSKAMQRGAR